MIKNIHLKICIRVHSVKVGVHTPLVTSAGNCDHVSMNKFGVELLNATDLLRA